MTGWKTLKPCFRFSWMKSHGLVYFWMNSYSLKAKRSDEKNLLHCWKNIDSRFFIPKDNMCFIPTHLLQPTSNSIDQQKNYTLYDQMVHFRLRRDSLLCLYCVTHIVWIIQYYFGPIGFSKKMPYYSTLPLLSEDKLPMSSNFSITIYPNKMRFNISNDY